MTRNEAIKLYYAKAVGNGIEGYIDFFIEIGMLKVEEEKTIELKAVKTLSYFSSFPERIISALDKAGLKIVEKDK